MNFHNLSLFLLLLLPQGYTGHKTEFYPDGKMKSDGIYITNLKEGKWREWYEEKGENRNVYFMQSVGKYIHGKKDSFWMERHLISDLPLNNYVPGSVPVWIEGDYKNGKRTGIWKEYLMDGKPYYKLHKKWENRGKLTAQAEYEDGKIEGMFIRNWWGDAKDDTLKEGSITETIKNDYLNGFYQDYRDEKIRTYSHILIESGEYKNNLKTGTWKQYNEIHNKKQTIIRKTEQDYFAGKPSGELKEFIYKDGNWGKTSEF